MIRGNKISYFVRCITNFPWERISRRDRARSLLTQTTCALFSRQSLCTRIRLESRISSLLFLPAEERHGALIFSKCTRIVRQGHRNFSPPQTVGPHWRFRFVQGRAKARSVMHNAFSRWQRDAFASCNHQGEPEVLEARLKGVGKGFDVNSLVDTRSEK